MEDKKLNLNQETIDILVANVIPTTKYFESRFDHMQYQIDEIKNNQVTLRQDIDKRFDEFALNIDKRFDEFSSNIDKRFDEVNKNHIALKQDMDKKFDQVNESIMNLTIKIEQLTKSNETSVRDYIIERDRHYDKKFAQLRTFNIAIVSLVAGVFLKMLGFIQI